MKFFIGALFFVSISTVTAYCCDSYNVGGECCNIFGCNCEGPCWNAGCLTECQKGTFPGRPVSCLGINNKYDCCPLGSSCVPNCNAVYIGDCCCAAGQDQQTIAIGGVTYDFNKVEKGSSNAMIVKIKYKGTNAGNKNAVVGKVSSSVSYTQTTSWQFTTTTKISVSASVKAGIPFFADGEIKTTVETGFTYGESETKSVSNQVAIDTGNDSIPPYSYQSYQFDAKMFSFRIPFTAIAVVQDQCGTQSVNQITGVATLDGVAQFVEGEFTKLVGPAVPIECNSPFDTPIEEQRFTRFCSTGSIKCKDNALCVRYGLGNDGDCCIPGHMRGCCAYAEAHSSCLQDGFKDTDVLCPSPTGNFHPCCTGVSGKFSFEIEQVEEMTKEQQALVLHHAQALECLPNSQVDTQIQIAEEERIPAIPIIAECKLY